MRPRVPRLEDLALTKAAWHVNRSVRAAATRRLVRKTSHRRVRRFAGQPAGPARCAPAVGAVVEGDTVSATGGANAGRKKNASQPTKTRRLPPALPPRSYTSLAPLPPPLVLALLDAVLAAGRLTPASLALFLEADVADVDARLAALRVDLPPPVVLSDSTRGWLGYERPGWQ